MSEKTDTIHILHVDDDPSLNDMVATFLEREDDRITVQTATSAESGREMLADHNIDCVVSDYEMPGDDGIEFLQSVREEQPDLPFILYTGKGSEEVASDAISAGVTDYLQKESGTDQYTILANRVENAVERYRAECEAAQTRTQLRAISENSTDAIVIIDADSYIQFANPAVEDHFGYTPSELQGQRLTTIMPQRYREQHLAAVERYLQTGEQSLDWTDVEFSGLHKDETEVPVSISYGKFQQDGEPRFIGIIRDISERTRMEAQLREREERFRQLAENIGEVVWMSDPEKEELIYVNPAYEEIWGQSTAVLYDDPTAFLGAVHPEDRDRVEAALDTQIRGEYDEEYRIIRPDGELRWVRDRAVPVENDEGEVYRMVGIASDITERKEQTRQLETLISNLPGMVYRCRNEPHWPMNLVRGECEDLTGYSAAELESSDVVWGEEVIHPKDQDRMWTTVQGAVDSGFPFEVTYRIQTKGGATRWMWERGRVVKPEYNEETLLEGFITDITERKEREQELEQTNALLSTLIEALPVGVLAEDESRDVLTVNTRLFELFELSGSPAEATGADCEQLAEEVSEMFVESERFIERTNDLLAAYEPVDDEELALADGRTFERSHRPINLPNGDGNLWIYRDVTDRTQREKEREKTIGFLQSLYEVATDWSADTTEKITRLLEIGPETLNLPSGYLTRIEVTDEANEMGTQRVIEASGDHESLQPGDSCPLSDSYCRQTIKTDRVVAIRDALAAGWEDDPAYKRFNLGCYIGTTITVNNDLYGTVFFASETPREHPFTDADRTFVRLMSQLVSYELERNHAQQELQQQNERLKEFASIVSHDLRNPLNVAEGRLELARQEDDNEHLESVERAHERMNILIDDLLTLAREGNEATDMEPVSLADCSESWWRTVATAGATLVTEADRTLTADRTQLQQLLENLYRNAVEHSEKDVTVTVGELDDGFYVEDDGSGIVESEREKVFDAGYSTNESGTGFGLSIVKQIVESHDWEIRVTESSDGGARFEITGVDFSE